MVRRIGQDTYRVKVGAGHFRERHESQLRARDPDIRGKHVSLDYRARQVDLDDGYAKQEDYIVEKILAVFGNLTGHASKHAQVTTTVPMLPRRPPQPESNPPCS